MLVPHYGAALKLSDIGNVLEGGKRMFISEHVSYNLHFNTNKFQLESWEGTTFWHRIKPGVKP